MGCYSVRLLSHCSNAHCRSKVLCQERCCILIMIIVKQPSISLKLSPGSPHPSSHSTVLKMVNSSPGGSSSPVTSCESNISMVSGLAKQVRAQRHCFRDDLWIEEEKKRQRRLTRASPKMGAHPREEVEEVRVTTMLSKLFSLCFLLCCLCSFLKTLHCLLHLFTVILSTFALLTISPLLLFLGTAFPLRLQFALLACILYLGQHRYAFSNSTAWYGGGFGLLCLNTTNTRFSLFVLLTS